jgi:hypothetical protein
METQVRTPQLVFMQPQRLIVPLFQRPYVWTKESQWEPLWEDIVRVSERLLAAPTAHHQPHFLGAVVLQQLQNPIGSLQTRTVIDGQQRLTTLQVLLDALQAEFVAAGATQPALRLEALIRNPDPFCSKQEDRFKVWPTNRDRPAFNAVMAAEPPIAYASLEYRGTRLVDAHQYFAESARAWLHQNGSQDIPLRAEKLEHTVRELLQIVVIDLTADENAQEIFETLNARGAHLTAADLIKNFVFQRLMEAGDDVEAAYESNWKEFETGFWEAEVNFGRLRYSRSSILMNHWLIARTGEEIVAREVFSRFKRYADHEAGVPMPELVAQVDRASAVYRMFIEGSTANNPIGRLQLFAYRTNVLESEVFKPVILWLYDPEQERVPDGQLLKALEVLESWLVRRMLVRAQTSSYTQIAAELITQLRKGERFAAGVIVEGFFATQTVVSRYWPADDEVSQELTSLAAYARLRRARLRMVLEAIEDHRRGWLGTQEGLGGERVARGKYHIEHVLPRRWQMKWPLPSTMSESDRERLVHTLGNLTLLTGKLNSKVSNSAWDLKRPALAEHDVLKLNSDLLAGAGDAWTEDQIRSRTQTMIKAVLEIWPVPEGHASAFAKAEERPREKVDVAALIASGLIDPGATLWARRKAQSHRTATVLPDGLIDVDGLGFQTPSGAAKHITGKSENGWWYFLVDPTSRRSLSDLLHEYVDQTSADVDEGEAAYDGDDEDDI